MKKLLIILTTLIYSLMTIATPITIVKPNFGTIYATDLQGKQYTQDATYDLPVGTSLTLTYIPKNDCSYFAEWHCVGSEVKDDILIVGTEAITLRARFQIVQYTIEADVVPNNAGTAVVRCGVGNIFLDVAGSVNCGSTIQLTAVADSQTGFKFIRWDDGNTQSQRLVSADDDRTYIAYFASKDTLQDLDNIENDTRARIYIKDGVLYIEHNEHIYNAQGMKIL